MALTNQVLYHCRSCNKDGVPQNRFSFKALFQNLLVPWYYFIGEPRPKVFTLKCPHCGSARVSPTIKEAGQREPLTSR